ncbi:MAG: radical SAM family heme chaperone HemW [Saprospirales bacterium]|jgi:oxygen-independent coproporphyrinogen-3 oxidase|nr:radical SAM family heme chaperone HemW [Saprospirales bacterium]MBK8923970.1 radical SAM family heme chaperone HemW [Saprospirales bacterium]
MPGLYLHIPFCKQACHYCNFHFSTTLRSKPALVQALLLELELQRGYLGGAELASIYFGGGTPSLLDFGELERLFEKIYQLHRVRSDAEITLEANPDDLDREKLRTLRDHTPVNRLSIGIQSFFDEDLRWMNRAHTAAHARACLRDAAAAGFQDLTLDLIYGAPTTSDAHWAENIRIALAEGIPHLSCYGLTVEAGTALAHFVRKGTAPPVEEEQAAHQFEYLQSAMEAAGYEHYEISNFALPGRYARHNSSYWRGEPYLGVGPSAHSYDGVSRQWNVSNNARYLRALEAGELPFEREALTPAQRYNEYVMTGLRTLWGCEHERLEAFGAPFAGFFRAGIQPYLSAGTAAFDEGRYRLTRAGKLLADRIASDLFWVGEVK